MTEQQQTPQAPQAPPEPFLAEVRRFMDHRGIVIEEVSRMLAPLTFNFQGDDKPYKPPEPPKPLPIPRYHIQMAVLIGPDKQHLMQIPIHAAFDAADIEDAFAKAEAEIQKATHAEIKRRQEEAVKPRLVTPRG